MRWIPPTQKNALIISPINIKGYKDNFITLEKDKINIIYIDNSFDDQIHYMIGKKK